MKETAGTLLWRRTERGVEILLVHPAGNYNRLSPWSIPKGLPDPGEELEAAARRETMEEAGVTALDLIPLGHCDYIKSKKRVHCFFGKAPDDAEPHRNSWEIDRAEFVSLKDAYKLLHPDQQPFLDRMRVLLSNLKT